MATAFSETGVKKSHTPDPSATWAVLAYVPEDFIWADWLHRVLHDRIVAEPLVGQRTRHGFTRPSHISAFPDPRDPAQVARYGDALQLGKYLVVVCSPHSSHSEWVDDQIKAFKRGGGEERIVALVVDGDPDDSAVDHKRDTEWLPAWLRWRLGEDNQFQLADVSEPVIVDGRRGTANLTQILVELLAILLDMPTEQVHAAILEHDGRATVSADDLAQATPGGGRQRPAEKPKYIPIIIGAAALVLLGAGGAMLIKKGSTKSLPLDPVTPTTVVATPETDPSDVKEPAPSATPEVKPAPPRNPTSTSERPLAQAAPPSLSVGAADFPSVPEIDPPRPSGSDPDLTDAPTTSLNESTPKPATRPKVKSQWKRLEDYGDLLMKNRNQPAAVLAYSEAIEVALKAADASPNDVELQIEVATLCQRVGQIQVAYSSQAEAKATLQKGRNILLKIKNRSSGKAREKAIQDIESGLQKLRD